MQMLLKLIVMVCHDDYAGDGNVSDGNSDDRNADLGNVGGKNGRSDRNGGHEIIVVVVGMI